MTPQGRLFINEIRESSSSNGDTDNILSEFNEEETV